MVKVRPDLPRSPQGQVNLPLWVDQLCQAHEHLDAEKLEVVTSWLDHNYPDLLARGLELADLVAELKMDMASVLAALAYRGVRENRVPHAELVDIVGAEATGIAEAVAEMATTSLLEMSNSPLQEKEQQDQVENVKRMLVSLIEDARVAVVKLAERVTVLRHAKAYDVARRKRIALEAREIFAPLAGRLGIWQLKWELEDLALRYLHEDVYQEIARNLAGKRAEREAQVEHMVDQVRGLLRGHGIDAVVYGRAKHIYSIWRKMQSKSVSFDQVYDVRAVRVVVETLAECYAALGVLHTTWPHIPSEFDDYIANPKENGYQSIHTAVTASDGRTLEIQIRTRAMHEDAELGVCAHWSYKEGHREEGAYAEKMDWLRQVMEWHEELAGTETLSTLLQHRINADRIFVSTPKGHVLELPSGATALDFAYRVHTDVGHTCRAVRINGMFAPLNRALETGQQVEIITQSGAPPMREWLEADLGYVQTDRAKAKLLSYFRNLDAQVQFELGQSLLSAKLQALGFASLQSVDLTRFAHRHGFTDSSALLRAIGAAELSSLEIVGELIKPADAAAQLNLPGMDELQFPSTMRFRVVGENRDGLLHDITQVIGDMHLPLTGTMARVSNPTAQAIITIDVTLKSWSQTVNFVSCLSLISGVVDIRREAL